MAKYLKNNLIFQHLEKSVQQDLSINDKSKFYQKNHLNYFQACSAGAKTNMRRTFCAPQSQFKINPASI